MKISSVKAYALLCAFFCSVLVSCSPVSVEKAPFNLTKEDSFEILRNPQRTKEQSLQGKTVMIVPFSAYIVLSSPAEWFETNAKIYDAASFSLQEYGADVIPLNDVLAKMEEHNLLTSKLKKFLKRSQLSEREKMTFVRELNKSLNLNSMEVFKVASELGADLVFRSQLLAYREGVNRPLNPLTAGVVTGTLRLGSRVLYGRAEDEKWREAQGASVGAIAGAVIGVHAQDPFEPPRYETKTYGHPLLGSSYLKKVSGTTDYDLNNALVWAGAGAAVGYMAEHGGVNPTVELHERLAAFDVKTQKMVWSGSAQVKAEPSTFLSRDHRDVLTEKAMIATSRLLAASFVSRMEMYAQAGK